MQMTMIEALNKGLAQELERDTKVVLFGQDIGANGGVFRVTEHLQEKFGEQRGYIRGYKEGQQSLQVK